MRKEDDILSKEVKKERAGDGGGQIPQGIPTVCLIYLDLVRDKLRSDGQSARGATEQSRH